MVRKTVKVTQAAKEQAESGGGDFKPLEAGKYNVDIFDAEEAEIKKGPNTGVTGVRMQFRISAGQKGANRRVFNTVWDTERWAPKDGKAEGAVNFQFHQFYKALGFDLSNEEFELPDVEDLLGEGLTVNLKVVADDYKFKKALAEWQGVEPDEEKAEAHAKWAAGKPVKGNFLTNKIGEFLPLEDLDETVAEDDEDGFDL
jgi:hypothetical protein